MGDSSERLTKALADLDSVAGELAPEEAERALDAATLQVFWRDWPSVSAWAGALWRRLNEHLERPGTPVSEPDLDEVGGEGG